MAKPGEMAYDYEKILVEAAVRDGAGSPVTILRLPMVYGRAIRSGGCGRT